MSKDIIEFANLGLIGYNGPSWVVNALGGDNPYVWIPSPDWSRDLVIPEAGIPGTWSDTHAWSKWSGGTGIFAALSARQLAGTTLGNTPVTQLPGMMKDGVTNAFRNMRDNVKHFAKRSPNCFTEGTQIVVGMGLAEDGTVLYDTKNIEDIQVGDLVYSYDTVTGEVSQRKVTSTSSNTTKHVNQHVIVGENGIEQTIETTDGHPFWVVTDNPDLSRAAQNVINENGVWLHHENLGVTETGYWVEAKDLRVGDVFLGANRELSTVLCMEKVQCNTTVYNIEVEGNHNYFVLAKEFEYGQTCVLVHNMCPGGGSISGVNIPGITAKYKNLECVECAKDVVENLKKAGVHGNLVHIRSGRDFIYSDIAKKSISENGYHVGVEVKGIVYDNIHKNGLTFKAWINDFNAPSGIHILKESF